MSAPEEDTPTPADPSAGEPPVEQKAAPEAGIGASSEAEALNEQTARPTEDGDSAQAENAQADQATDAVPADGAGAGEPPVADAPNEEQSGESAAAESVGGSVELEQQHGPTDAPGDTQPEQAVGDELADADAAAEQEVIDGAAPAVGEAAEAGDSDTVAKDPDQQDGEVLAGSKDSAAEDATATDTSTATEQPAETPGAPQDGDQQNRESAVAEETDGGEGEDADEAAAEATEDMIGDNSEEDDEEMGEERIAEKEGVEVEELMKLQREQLMEEFQTVNTDLTSLSGQCVALQGKLAEYFRRKKADERHDQPQQRRQQLAQRQESEDPANSMQKADEYKTRYVKYMTVLDDATRMLSHVEQTYGEELSRLAELVKEADDEANAVHDQYRHHRFEGAMQSVSAATGKPFREEELLEYEEQERRKEEEVRKVRVECIRQGIRLQKREEVLQQHETLEDGSRLNIIDFEQLKVENTSLFETVDSRANDVKRLENKIADNVNCMSHHLEKSSDIQISNARNREALAIMEEKVSEMRDQLGKYKKRRDQLRIENQKLKEDGGLLGQPTLLQDFAKKQDKVSDVHMSISDSQERHRMLSDYASRLRSHHIQWYEMAISKMKHMLPQERNPMTTVASGGHRGPRGRRVPF